MRPLHDYVLIDPIKEETSSYGTFVVQDKKAPLKAEVLDVGDEVTKVKKGQTVVYSQYSTHSINLDGKDLFLVKEEELLMVK